MKKREQAKALANAFNEIEKEFGKGAVMRLSDRPNINIDVIDSGSLSLNLILGVKGYARGRIVEIFGPESAGKTTLALHAIAQAQNQGLNCAFIDAEHAIDPEYAKNLGVNIKNLILSQPDSGEQALAIVEHLVKSSQIGLIVIDSVAALVPQIELDGEMTDQTIGAQARLMSKALRKLSGAISKSNTTIIFINQIRMKIGVIFGNPEVTPGGRALKFYASVRLDVRKGQRIIEGSEVVGIEMKVKVVKNKIAPPFKMTTLVIRYGSGIDSIEEMINLGIEYGILSRSGAWYYYHKKQMGQGKNGAKEFLVNNLNIKTKIIQEIIEKYENN